mgnify:CR=1 FL=1
MTRPKTINRGAADLAARILRKGNRMASPAAVDTRKIGPDGAVYVLWTDDSGAGLKAFLQDWDARARKKKGGL